MTTIKKQLDNNISQLTQLLETYKNNEPTVQLITQIQQHIHGALKKFRYIAELKNDQEELYTEALKRFVQPGVYTDKESQQELRKSPQMQTFKLLTQIGDLIKTFENNSDVEEQNPQLKNLVDIVYSYAPICKTHLETYSKRNIEEWRKNPLEHYEFPQITANELVANNVLNTQELKLEQFNEQTFQEESKDALFYLQYVDAYFHKILPKMYEKASEELAKNTTNTFATFDVQTIPFKN
jgi:hypothetical protein